ncbi:HAD family hydrolase [Kitasatospora sp. NPDC058218]|uniref:HAD family hydrolase n=1 Tax=Kitasatospora sp. NPDC058218 TaxID=3346385 RepID=UPI0036D96786
MPAGDPRPAPPRPRVAVQRPLRHARHGLPLAPRRPTPPPPDRPGPEVGPHHRRRPSRPDRSRHGPRHRCGRRERHPGRLHRHQRWSLYPHALHVLDALSAAGWQHVVVSNHVPELPAILAATELAPRLAAVVNSADTGYEKPRPEAFRLAQQAAADTGRMWMVGDNPHADIAGARAAGIDAIWVQRPYPADTPDLRAVVRLILDQPTPAREAAAGVWDTPPVTADAARRTVRIG